MTYHMLGRGFSTGEWESLCTRCGLCCYEKFEAQGQVVFTDIPCQYLSLENTCKVYHKRQQVCEDCYEVTPQVVLEGDLLPPECSYVQLAATLRDEGALEPLPPAPPAQSERERRLAARERREDEPRSRRVLDRRRTRH